MPSKLDFLHSFMRVSGFGASDVSFNTDLKRQRFDLHLVSVVPANEEPAPAQVSDNEEAGIYPDLGFKFLYIEAK